MRCALIAPMDLPKWTPAAQLSVRAYTPVETVPAHLHTATWPIAQLALLADIWIEWSISCWNNWLAEMHLCEPIQWLWRCAVKQPQAAYVRQLLERICLLACLELSWETIQSESWSKNTMVVQVQMNTTDSLKHLVSVATMMHSAIEI